MLFVSKHKKKEHILTETPIDSHIDSLKRELNNPCLRI